MKTSATGHARARMLPRSAIAARARQCSAVAASPRESTAVAPELGARLMHEGTTIRLVMVPEDPDNPGSVLHDGADTATWSAWAPSSSRAGGDAADETGAMTWNATDERWEAYIDSTGFETGAWEWGVSAVVTTYNLVEYSSFHLKA